MNFRSLLPLWRRLSRAGFSESAVGELLDAGLEDRLHLMLADLTQPRQHRGALAAALRGACGVPTGNRGVRWPMAVLVSVKVPAGEGRRLPDRMVRLAEVLSQGGVVRKTFGLGEGCDARVCPVPLVPEGTVWFSESVWRNFARTESADIPERAAVGWRRVAFPPLVRRSEIFTAAVPVVVSAGERMPCLRDVTPALDAWSAASLDCGGADAAVACPRPVWEIPSDALMLGASMVAVARSLVPGGVELAAGELIGDLVHSVRGEKLVSVRCDAMGVVVTAHFLDGDDLLGHYSLSSDLLAAVCAALVAGGELSVIRASGEVMRMELPGKVTFPSLPSGRAGGVH